MASRSALPLDGFGARRRRLRAGDLLGGQGKRLRKLRERRLPPQLSREVLAGKANGGGALLEAPADLDGAVVTEKAPDLARDLRHGIGGKLRAVAQVEPGHGLEKAEAAELIQVVRVDAAPEKSPREF